MLNVAIYDPRHLNEEAFLASFVARRDTVDFLIEQLRKLLPSGEATHRLIVGQRGMGKTSLLRRLAISVTRDDKLAARYVPLTFREEQYNVRNIEKFWRNCTEALAEWLEQTGNSKLAADIDRDMQTEKLGNAQAAREHFLSLTASLNKRPILLIDNLDLVLDAIPSEQHWDLRRVLQDKHGPILFGASTQFLRQSSDRDAAFYEFFQVHQLEPLSEGELIKCMYRLVEVRGESAKPVRAILDNEPERLRVLHTLTGGNPRVLILIYKLLERADSESVFTDLESLLDQLTPFYKSRVEELKSDLQRAILDAIALNWDPITTNNLSKVTGVEVTTLSPQLQRLRRQGLVEEVPTSGARSGYQIVERFLNIWYLMRHGTRRARNRMRWLAAFLQSFYSVDQLKLLRATIFASNDKSRWRPLYDEAISVAMEKIAEKLPLFPDLPAPRSDHVSFRRRSETARQETEVELRAAINRQPEAAVNWNKLGKLLANDQRASEAADAFRRAADLQPDSAAYWHDVARHLKRSTDRHVEAEAAYRRSIEIDGDDASRWAGLADLLATKLRRYDEAESAFRHAIELDSRNEYAWSGLATLLHYHLRSPEAAENAYRKLIELNKESVIAWHSLGRLLETSLARHDEAEAAYRRTIDIDEQHETAWDDLGDLLTHRFERYSEAEAVYRQGLKVNTRSTLLRVGLGHVLGAHLNRLDEAEAVFREAIEIDSKSVSSWRALGNLLGSGFNRYEEAEASFREAIKINPNDSGSWDDLGDLLLHLNRDEDAESAFRNALDARPNFFSACSSLSRLLYRKGRHQDAEQLLRHAIELSPKSSRAWGELGELLGREVDRYQEAEDAFRQALKIAPSSARVQTDFSLLLAKRGKLEDAETAVRHAIEIDQNYARAWSLLGFLLSEQSRNRNDIETALRKAVDLSPDVSFYWEYLGQFHLDAFNFDEAAIAFRRVVTLNPDNQEAWMTLGNLLKDHLAEFDEAKRAYDRAIALSGSLQTLAKGNLFWLYVETGKITEAEELRQQIGTLDRVGLALVDAALDLARDNFGSMTERLRSALSDEKLDSGYFDDLLRLLRLTERQGYGQRLLGWMRDTGVDATKAPVYAAFVAFIEGRQFLLDFNPEVRTPAQEIYSWLTSSIMRQKSAKIGNKRNRKRHNSAARK